jgi:N-acetylneuraminic acid mutarotase
VDVRSARAFVGLGALAACGRVGFTALPGAPPDAAPAPDADWSDIRAPGSWQPLPAAPIAPRVWTTGIWTGSRFFVFGGATDMAYDPTDTGALFDPATGTWTPSSTTGTPGARHTARMAMVGGKVIEYGGGVKLDATDGGGSYDPATDTWTAMGSSAPGPRIYGVALSIGDRLMTWGGWASTTGHVDTGDLYDPATDTWTAMSTAGAPSARSFATAVWTGSEVIVWGGCSGGMPDCATAKGDGAIYDPATDTWRPMSSTGAPEPREQHVAVWTGSEMIVFGGATGAREAGPLNTGAIYTPATDSWRPITTTGAPSPRVDAAGVWMGNKMLVWGSDTGDISGYVYDPVADTWALIAVAGAPPPRSRFAFAASDHQLFVWGGSYTDTSGAVWTPGP